MDSFLWNGKGSIGLVYLYLFTYMLLIFMVHYYFGKETNRPTGAPILSQCLRCLDCSSWHDLADDFLLLWFRDREGFLMDPGVKKCNV